MIFCLPVIAKNSLSPFEAVTRAGPTSYKPKIEFGF